MMGWDKGAWLSVTSAQWPLTYGEQARGPAQNRGADWLGPSVCVSVWLCGCYVLRMSAREGRRRCLSCSLL